jgi:hypothetical protein
MRGFLSRTIRRSSQQSNKAAASGEFMNLDTAAGKQALGPVEPI